MAWKAKESWRRESGGTIGQGGRIARAITRTWETKSSEHTPHIHICGGNAHVAARTGIQVVIERRDGVGSRASSMRWQPFNSDTLWRT